MELLEGSSRQSTFPSPDGEALAKRLRSRAFNLREAKAAIQGQQLPASLGRLATQFAVVRGIRLHPSFASGPAAVLRGVRPLFTRALNARAIMSNEVPDMTANDEFPYCIWHPDLPSKKTLQELVARYPQMRYQVGRVCAIAGHTDLYRTLHILPEVAIAKEARESGSLEIYEEILGAPVKWQVFDDHRGSLCVSDPRPARLNGDTCIRSWLDLKQPIFPPVGLISGEDGDPEPGDDADPEEYLFTDSPDHEIFGFPGYRQPHFNVTEDMQLDTTSSRPRYSFPFRSPDWECDRFDDIYDPDGPREALPELPEVVTRLLYEPIPEDLPTCDKDWLIRMAAYYGNIDRYTRLRRPWFVQDELRCIERGIYHNALFARWWASHVTKDTNPIIVRAVNARYIMSDDLSRFLGHNPRNLHYPYHIWYPDIAHVHTYRALALHFPDMRRQVIRAAIYADYQDLFDLLMNGAESKAPATHLQETYDSWAIVGHEGALEPTRPDHYHYLEARFSPNPHYKAVLLQKAAELGIDITSAGSLPDLIRRRRLECLREEHQIRDTIVADHIDLRVGVATFTCDARYFESYILRPREWQPKAEEPARIEKSQLFLQCYDNWPRSVWKIVDSIR